MVLLITNIYTQIFEIFIPPRRVYNFVLYNIKRFDINCIIISVLRDLYQTIDCYEKISELYFLIFILKSIRKNDTTLVFDKVVLG